MINNNSINRQLKPLLLATHLVLLLLVCNGVYAQPVELKANSAESNNYKIGVDDVLNVIVPRKNSFSAKGVVVSYEGTIKLPEITEEIAAACLTESELAVSITEKYKKYLLDPKVTVEVKEFRSNPVAVIGAVNSTKTFNVQRPTRLLDILALVKGPSEQAGPSIQILRYTAFNRCGSKAVSSLGNENDRELLVISLAETMKGSENANPLVQAGDIISIAEADKPEAAYIIGNVKSARTITLSEPITLSKAIAMAGGVTAGAKTKKIKISRQNPESLAKTVIFVNLKEISNNNQKDILLLPNDIVEVPGPSGARKFMSDIFKTLVRAGTRGIVPIP